MCFNSSQFVLSYKKSKLYKTLYSISVFQKRTLDQFVHQILCNIFQEKCFSCCVLLTDQIPLSNCLYFLRYCTIRFLGLFINLAVTSQNLKFSHTSGCTYKHITFLKSTLQLKKAQQCFVHLLSVLLDNLKHFFREFYKLYWVL